MYVDATGPRKTLVRKYLTASLSACLVSASFVGCGDKSQEAQVSAQLETLLDQMSRLQYADAPVEGNKLVYTLGKEINGVKVPGSTRFEAAYLDQALALLPLAEQIEANGTELQKQSANAIIGSIKTDEAEKLEIDAWISERVANLAEFKRQRLDGEPAATTEGLLDNLAGLIGEAGEETNIPPSSDVQGNLLAMLADAKQASGDDAFKAAAFLLAMSDYASAGTPNQGERQRLVQAVDRLVLEAIGVIGTLEMKIEQIKVERQRVADKLAEIEADRQQVLSELSTAFAERDAMIQAAGFARMAEAIETLKQAEDAVKASGKNTGLELMSVYTLHARALQQQSVSARLYRTTLASIAAAGPELLGSELHGTVSDRVQDMDELLGQVKTAVAELESEASNTVSSLPTDTDATEGQIASRQIEVYQSLVANAQQGGGATPAPSIDEPEPAPAEPEETTDPAAS